MSRLMALLVTTALCAAPAAAQYQRTDGTAADLRSSSLRPRGLEQVGFDQRVGGKVPLQLELTAEDGTAVRLGEVIGERPVILALVYYECPMLCNLVLDGLIRSLKAVEFSAGQEFDVVAVSFDPDEPASLAGAKREAYIGAYGRPDAADGFRFLVGDEPGIAALTEAVGFRYRYVEERDEYAHASGIVILTPDGTIARYFYGIEYPPRDVRLGLVEAAAGRIGSVVDQALLFCFHYDPNTGTYGAMTMRLVRLAGAATLLIAGGLIALALRRERRQRLAVTGGAR